MFFSSSASLGLKYLCDLRHVIVQISGSENNQHIEVTAFDKVKHVLLVYHALLHSGLQIVVDKLARDSGYGLFARRIDVTEYHFIKLAQRVGKVFVEVTGTCVEMRLEYRRYLTVGIQLPYARAL